MSATEFLITKHSENTKVRPEDFCHGGHGDPTRRSRINELSARGGGPRKTRKQARSAEGGNQRASVELRMLRFARLKRSSTLISWSRWERRGFAGIAKSAKRCRGEVRLGVKDAGQPPRAENHWHRGVRCP
jgi:hypothetical protein